MLQSRGQLHDGTEVVELVTLPGQLDEELQCLHTIYEVALVGNTPHEEERHLQSVRISIERR